jgi:hypothetical protein
MKIYYCEKCDKIDPNNMFDKICSVCGNKKKEDIIFPTEYSDVDNFIINAKIYNSIFGDKK